MTFPLVVLAAAGIGIGLVMVIVSVRTPRPSVVEALHRMSRPVRAEAQPAGSTVLAAVARSIGMEHLMTNAVRRDLRSLDRNLDDHLARCLMSAVAGALMPPVIAALAALAGLGVSISLPAGASVLLAACGVALPTVVLHRQAEQSRADFKHALSAYLNLVGVNVAAGRGVEGALETAAASGQGPAFTAIRTALYRAQMAGQTPWAALDNLGDDIGVDELRELAATIALAGGAGAKVRESLAAKAATLRRRGLADVQAAANSASERMAIPVVLLVIGLIMFIGFPAVSRILTGF